MGNPWIVFGDEVCLSWLLSSNWDLLMVSLGSCCCSLSFSALYVVGELFLCGWYEEALTLLSRVPTVPLENSCFTFLRFMRTQI